MLSQNFIKSFELVKELVATAKLEPKDTVIEVGPGKGIITEELVRKVDEVIAVEKDSGLVALLREQFKHCLNLKIVQQDFLKYNLPLKPYKVVANIPFEITAEIVNKFLTATQMPESLHLIMQLEAAEKFVGVPTETQSSILTKPWYEIKILGDIDRSSFTKKPQVTIVFVEFLKRKKPFLGEEYRRDYRDWVMYGFNHWAATWAAAYKEVLSYTQLKTLEKRFKLATSKPSEVTIDDWLLIFKTSRKFLTEKQKEEIRNWVKRLIR